MPATKSPKPFADLDAAMDALDARDLVSDIQGAIDEVQDAETVEDMNGFATSMGGVEEMLLKALKRVQSLKARAIITLHNEITA